MKILRMTVFVLVAVIGTQFPGEAAAERLKDLVDIVGARSNQMVGYGLVVGLQGTGDSQKAEFTLQSVVAMLRRLGVRVDGSSIKLKNAAAVIVTVDVPAFIRSGQSLDVTVSSIGDAKSLRGGTLILTPLKGADSKVYAVAQGSVLVGGFSAGARGASKKSGHTTVGRIPGGGTMEKEIPTQIVMGKRISLSLREPDPKVAAALVAGVNGALSGDYARASDPGTVEISLPEEFDGREVDLLALIGDLEVDREVPARIVINERTGTVVVGDGVRLRPAAIAHGGLVVQIRQDKTVSQPSSFTMGGSTTVIEETEVDAEMTPGELHSIPATATVSDLVNALNALGVKPSDLIIIFQSLASAGAITAKIEVQ